MWVFVIVMACVLTLFLLITLVSMVIYNKIFAVKIYTRPLFVNRLDMYTGLSRQRVEYVGNNGQRIVGYWYTVGDSQQAVLVFAHGFGCGGHTVHMAVYYYFAQRGYAVLAYDVTGCDESGTRNVGAFPQGVADMDYALRHAKASRYGYLPIVIMGHSWGGYSVGSVLEYHPDVVAVAMMAAVNSSTGQLIGSMYSKVGVLSKMLVPGIRLVELLKMGKYSRSSCVRGMSKSSATCIVIHSSDDATVPKAFSYDTISRHHSRRADTIFVPLEGRGHGFMFYTDSMRQYYLELGSVGPGYFSRNGSSDTVGEIDVDMVRYFNIDQQYFDNIYAIFQDAIAKAN